MTRNVEDNYVVYNTRKFRKDLHARVKIYAAQQRITMEEALNIVVEKGMAKILEEMQAAKGGA